MGVKFIQGNRVIDNYSERIGEITGKKTPFAESFRWEIDFGGEKKYIRESDLELVTNDADLFELFKQEKFHGILDLRRIIQGIRLSGKLTNIFYSMHSGGTEFMPHQFKPVMKFIESVTGRLLIADEVGLGKTIEAIYVWKELLARENAKRFLIVCPAQLCQKWKDDLFNFFGINSNICKAEELLKRFSQTFKSFNSDNFVLIASIQGIRYREKESGKINPSDFRYKLNDFLEKLDADNSQELFDLLVIDEAHYLRNSATASYKTGERLRNISRYMILLSATPIQTGSDNFYNLLSLLSPEDFHNRYVFDIMLQENRSTIAFANALRNNRPKNELRDIYREIQHKLFEDSLLNKKIQSYLNRDNNTIQDRMVLFHSIKDMNFYNQYFTRTRKRDAFEKRVLREAKTIKYSFSDEENNMYQKISYTLKQKAKNASMSGVFALIARQRQMTSSLPAALKHWNDHDVMEEMFYEDLGFGEEDYELEIDSLSETEIPETLIEKFSKNDSKYDKLLELISGILKENKGEKIIIFSYYRYSVTYLYERLSKDDFSCVKIMGSMTSDEKKDAVDHFENSPSCNILISTEVLAEGVDLQFASVEINYDLPWNPMRLEQRIGRIDRIGQKKDKIKIFNFICESTVEDRVLERLYERIDIFTHAIGDIEEILGEEISELSKFLFSFSLSEEQLEKQAIQKIEAIVLRQKAMEELEEQSGISAEFSDVIMANVMNADSMKRYIEAEELIHYTKDFFALKYAGSRIEKNDEKSCYITLSLEAREEFQEYVKKNHYRVSSLGYRNDPILCIFNSNKDSYKRHRIYELIDINHAFIRWIKELSQKKSFNTHPCSAIKVKSSCVPEAQKGLYTYFIQKWEFEGYKNINELKFSVIYTETGTAIDEKIAEKLVISSINSGEDFSEIRYGLNNFKTILDSLEKCKEFAYSSFDEHEVKFLEENKLKCDGSKEYLTRTYNRKISSIDELIKKAQEAEQAERIIRLHEGRRKKADETFAIQLKKMESKEKGSCTFSDLAVGIIKVEG